jgi:hypothetical protein
MLETRRTSVESIPALVIRLSVVTRAYRAELTVLKIVLTLVPRLLTIVTQATAIRLAIIAYSSAVTARLSPISPDSFETKYSMSLVSLPVLASLATCFGEELRGRHDSAIWIEAGSGLQITFSYGKFIVALAREASLSD